MTTSSVESVEYLREEIERQKADRSRLLSFIDTLEAEQEAQAAEIEQLRKKAGQRGARMQIIREYLMQYSGGSATLWRDFCRTKPDAADWFDADGVPK